MDNEKLKSKLVSYGKVLVKDVLEKEFDGSLKKVAGKGVKAGGLPVVLAFIVKFLGELIMGDEVENDVALFFGVGLSSCFSMASNFWKHRGLKPGKREGADYGKND